MKKLVLALAVTLAVTHVAPTFAAYDIDPKKAGFTVHYIDAGTNGEWVLDAEKSTPAPHGLSDATVENLYGACVAEQKATVTFRNVHDVEHEKKQVRSGMLVGGVVSAIAIAATGGAATPFMAIMGGVVAGGFVGGGADAISQHNQWDNESRDAAIPCTDDLIKTFSLTGTN